MKTLQLAIITGVLLLSTGVAAREIKKNYHESFEVEKGATLKLEHGDGNVEIVPWDKPTIDIKVKYHAEVSGVEMRSYEFSVSFKHSGNTVRVVEDKSGGIMFGSFRTVEHKYEIRAPSDTVLKLRGSDGDVQVKNWQSTIKAISSDGSVALSNVSGKIDVRTSDGKITLSNIYGNVDAYSSDGNISVANAQTSSISVRTSDGDVSIENSRGDIDVDTSDGSISLVNVATRRLDASTSDGSLTATLLSVENPHWQIKTSDGRVEVKLPRDVSARYTIKSGDGRVSIEHPGNQTTYADNSTTEGNFGAGDGRLSVSSSDGSITLLSQ